MPRATDKKKTPKTTTRSVGSRLRLISEKIQVIDYLSYRDLLKQIYLLQKSADSSYSYVQLAEDLGFSKSNVIWLVISGRRRLSRQAAERIAEALNLNGPSRRYFELMRTYNNARQTAKREEIFAGMVAAKSKLTTSSHSQRALEYYSEWYHPVIRELAGLADFQSDPAWVNQRLVTPLLPMQIHRSLELLEQLELIAYDRKKGRHIPTAGQVLPDRDVQRLASVRFHQKMCDLARDAVTRVPAARREMNTLTVRVSDAMAMKASEILFKACEQIMKLENKAKDGDQIYQINVHLFPHTRHFHATNLDEPELEIAPAAKPKGDSK